MVCVDLLPEDTFNQSDPSNPGKYETLRGILLRWVLVPCAAWQHRLNGKPAACRAEVTGSNPGAAL